MPKGNIYKTETLDTNLTNSPELYLALFQTDPGADGSGTEVSYSGYARIPIVWGPAVINGSLGEKKNTNFIEFGTVPSTSGYAAYAAVMTLASGGDVVYYGALGANYQLMAGIKPTVPIGSLTITES